VYVLWWAHPYFGTDSFAPLNILREMILQIMQILSNFALTGRSETSARTQNCNLDFFDVTHRHSQIDCDVTDMLSTRTYLTIMYQNIIILTVLYPQDVNPLTPELNP
jgi:hypothetical protein